MEQKRFSFDEATLAKLWNSFILNLISAIGVLLASYGSDGNVKKAIMLALASFGAFLVNIPREYIKGE